MKNFKPYCVQLLLLSIAFITFSCSTDEAINGLPEAFDIKSSESVILTFEGGDTKVIHHNGMNELFINDEFIADYVYEDINALMINEQMGEDFYYFENQYTGDQFRMEDIVVDEANNTIYFDFFLNNQLLGSNHKITVFPDIEVDISQSACPWWCYVIAPIFPVLSDGIKEYGETNRHNSSEDTCRIAILSCTASGNRACLNRDSNGKCNVECKENTNE